MFTLSVEREIKQNNENLTRRGRDNSDKNSWLSREGSQGGAQRLLNEFATEC